METRFSCLQTRSGAQNTGDRAQARRNAPEVPEQAISLRDDACTVRGMSTQSRFRGGGKWGLSAPVSKMGGGFLFGRARPHQFVVALDFQLAAVEHGEVAQVAVETDTLAGRCVLVSGELAIAVGPSLPFPFIPNDSRHGSLPRTLEVFCRHAGPSASVVHTLATLREYYFDAVGPERRLTPFSPIRGRTVVCKGDGLLDCIGFNGSGQFSYFVRDDRKYHLQLLSVANVSLSNDFHNPATSTSLSHDRCGAPGPSPE